MRPSLIREEIEISPVNVATAIERRIVRLPFMSETLPRLSFAGTRRGRAPSETLSLLQPYLAEAGITRVAVVAGLDVCPIPVVMVTRPLSSSLSVTQGKGPTLETAKVSGLMEAVEHFHAETPAGAVRLASERELRTDCVATDRLAHRLPRYSPQRRLLWQAGVGLASRRAVWVPFDLVHLDLRRDGVASAPSFVPNSNGLASGNCVEEATVHALYEVLERHLVAKFYDLPVELQEARRLSIQSISDPECSALVSSLRGTGISLTVWDLTDEARIPCFFCELLGEHEQFRPLPAARGFGCHAESGVALSRAICEAAQSRVTSIAGSRDDMVPMSEEERRTREAGTREQWRLRSTTPAARLFRAIPTQRFDSFAQECATLVDSLSGAGCEEPVLVDLSKPDWPVSVVRVVVPGLRFEPTETGSFARGAEHAH